MTSIVSIGEEPFSLLEFIRANQTVVTAFCVAIGLSYFIFRRNPRWYHHLKRFDGPPFWPLVGSALYYIGPSEDFFEKANRLKNKYGTLYAIWIGNHYPYVIISDPVLVEKILTSTQHLDKGLVTKVCQPWLGQGLLTARREKWAQKRKIITPSFHFKILEDFLPIFNEQASVFLKCLESNTLLANGETVDLHPYIANCTLDIICETAMGKKIYAQTSLKYKNYIDAVTGYTDVLMKKGMQPWLLTPGLYYLSPCYRLEKHYLPILKEFTEEVVRIRKLERKGITQRGRLNSQVSIPNLGEPLQPDSSSRNAYRNKQRKAFLDLLLDAVEENEVILTDKEIREEVDTFMFEGHDTTSVSLSWLILMLAIHQECQRKLHQELDEIFGDNFARDITTTDISNMKYLDCCIKESLRLHSSVPFFFRETNHDVPITEDKIIPKGVTVIIDIFYIHRNPNYYSDPNTFNPERFCTENQSKRHPYAYIPFSAGPRNCLGQKFALMEEKVILTKLLRIYRVETKEKLENLRRAPGITLRCCNGVNVTLHRRDVKKEG